MNRFADILLLTAAVGKVLARNRPIHATRTQNVIVEPPNQPIVIPTVSLKPASVPSSRIGRLFQYSALAAGVGVGVAGEAIKRATGFSSNPQSSSLLLSSSNVNRIVNRLSKMRGAALKLGQMLSIQDNSMLPPEIEAVLLKVQNSANYMPIDQLQRTMRKELGDDWQSLFAEFDMVPFAAASIGQVHRAILPDGSVVAVKVQYPGVEKSIDSDLATLKQLILFSDFLPKGLYLDNTIRVAQKELAWECDYQRELQCMQEFASLLKNDPVFKIPKVFPHVSTKKILVTEFVPGVPLGKVVEMSQSIRNMVGKSMLHLCLRELFEFGFMQTDPNWSNFLYDARSRRIYLLDFGAARRFDKEFLDNYINVIKAAAERDVQGAIHWSQQLGFLTGMESEQMTNAHVNSLMHLAEPFATPGIFDFGRQDITSRVRDEIPTMLRERLTPPPDETYSLHRKLSGCFLLSAKLQAQIDCHQLFRRTYEQYH